MAIVQDRDARAFLHRAECDGASSPPLDSDFRAAMRIGDERDVLSVLAVERQESVTPGLRLVRDVAAALVARRVADQDSGNGFVPLDPKAIRARVAQPGAQATSSRPVRAHDRAPAHGEEPGCFPTPTRM